MTLQYWIRPKFSYGIYNFWIPLDSLFMESMFKLPHYSKIELTNFIWATQLFAYIDYKPEYEYTSLNKLYDFAYASSTPNILSKTFSPKVNLYHSLIKEACDNSATGINNGSELLNNFYLDQNYPNPFNPATRITYTIPNSGFVSLKVYNSLGQEIETLVSENQAKGKHEIEYTAKRLSSGCYFYRLQFDNKQETKKLLFIK